MGRVLGLKSGRFEFWEKINIELYCIDSMLCDTTDNLNQVNCCPVGKEGLYFGVSELLKY